MKMTIHNGGGLPTIINLLGSQVENIQLHSLQLLTKLARHRSSLFSLFSHSLRLSMCVLSLSLSVCVMFSVFHCFS